MDKSALEAIIGQLDGWSAFFTLLVTIGVGGELVVHFLSSRASKQLAEVEQLESKAMQQELAQCSERSDDFMRLMEQVRTEMAAASERMAKADERAELAQRRAARAEQEAQLERQARRLLEGEKLVSSRATPELDERAAGQSLTRIH